MKVDSALKQQLQDWMRLDSNSLHSNKDFIQLALFFGGKALRDTHKQLKRQNARPKKVVSWSTRSVLLLSGSKLCEIILFEILKQRIMYDEMNFEYCIWVVLVQRLTNIYK